MSNVSTPDICIYTNINYFAIDCMRTLYMKLINDAMISTAYDSRLLVHDDVMMITIE